MHCFIVWTVEHLQSIKECDIVAGDVWAVALLGRWVLRCGSSARQGSHMGGHLLLYQAKFVLGLWGSESNAVETEGC